MIFTSVNGVIIALVMLKFELFITMKWFIYLVITYFTCGVYYVAISTLSYMPIESSDWMINE
jgi:hypothetical protein